MARFDPALGPAAATNILNAAITTATGAAFQPNADIRVFQAALSNTTTPTAVVVIEGSCDPTNAGWVQLGTISLSGAQATDGFVSNAPWPHVRARVTSISGTSAAVTVWMGA